MTISIRERCKRLQAKITKAYSDIAALQDECTHPAVTKEYRGNTGNYDPSCDQYWIEYHCLDCNKRWHEDQK